MSGTVQPPWDVWGDVNILIDPTGPERLGRYLARLQAAGKQWPVSIAKNLGPTQYLVKGDLVICGQKLFDDFQTSHAAYGRVRVHEDAPIVDAIVDPWEGR